MANNYITYQTDVNASMDDASVTETVAGVTFPTGFAANKVVMLIVNRGNQGVESTLESAIQEAVDRIQKKIEETTQFN